jgi:putative flippase GtrA
MDKAGRIDSTSLRKLFTFLLVGGLAAGTYSLVCTALVHWLPAWRAAISISVHTTLIPIAYFAQRRLTFQSENPPLCEFAQYAGLQIISICLSTALLVRLVTESPYVNIAIFLMIAGLAAIISYFICNIFIFSPAKLSVRKASRQPLARTWHFVRYVMSRRRGDSGRLNERNPACGNS